MAKRPKPTKKAAESGRVNAEATFDRALLYIDAQITDVIDGKAAKTKHDPAYRVATLTKMIADIEAERRKSRAAEHKRVEKITRALVMAWARTLDPEERRSVAKEILAMDAGGSILA